MCLRIPEHKICLNLLDSLLRFSQAIPHSEQMPHPQLKELRFVSLPLVIYYILLHPYTTL